MPEEDTLEDRVWQLVIELGAAEGPVAVDRVLGMLSSLIVGQKDGAVNGLVSSKGLVRDIDRSGLRAPQSLAG